MVPAGPKVSVGMPIYNDARFLRPAIDSLLAQDYSNFELIISDNASTDGSRELCLEYAARDPRVKYHRSETNVGATENFRRAYRLSSGGEYFMYAGGHDLWAPTYLSRCVEVLESDKTIVQCNSIAQHMSQDGQVLETIRQVDTRGKSLFFGASLILWQISAYLLYSVIRTSALRKTRGLLNVCGPDLLLGFELALLGPFAIVPEPLFFLRDHRGDRSRPYNRAEGMSAFYKRMYPQGQAELGRFFLLKCRFEQMRAIQRSRLPFGRDPILMACVPLAYFLQFYRFVPEVARRRIRSLLNRWAAQRAASHEAGMKARSVAG